MKPLSIKRRLKGYRFVLDVLNKEDDSRDGYPFICNLLREWYYEKINGSDIDEYITDLFIELFKNRPKMRLCYTGIKVKFEDKHEPWYPENEVGRQLRIKWLKRIIKKLEKELEQSKQ